MLLFLSVFQETLSGVRLYSVTFDLLPLCRYLIGRGSSVFGDCPLSTCLTQNLGSSLQRGDETAGRDASDPLGFGKK
uniref:Secreted protein n=1 Tax=Amphiprion ocellaris TaxID=80972 RepID=A0AAQ5Z0Q7_AMPOC